MFQIFWVNQYQKNLSIKSVPKALKFFRDNQGFNLVGPIDFDPDRNCYNLQIWSEAGENSLYLGDIYAKTKAHLNKLYKTMYANGSVDKVVS